MAMATLRDLYSAELHDLMNAEQQIFETLASMSDCATFLDLRLALDEHRAETKVHIERLRLLIERLGEPARPTPSAVVAAVIEDATSRLANAEAGPSVDAELVAAVQRIAHYEIASYKTVCSHAESLGDWDAASVLRETLNEEEQVDRQFADMARHDGPARQPQHAMPGDRQDVDHASGPVSSTHRNAELTVAREGAEGGDKVVRNVPDSGDVNPRDTEAPKTTTPRIERYRER